MAIVSFWSRGTEETGKSSSIAAISTYMGINNNYKILVIDTKFNDHFYNDCFWKEDKFLKLVNKGNFRTDIGNGIEGLSKAILSNKISPEIITNYTKIVFNDNRLELLMDVLAKDDVYTSHKNIYKDIAKIANKYYDLVFIDIHSGLDSHTQDLLLEISDLIIVNLPQKLRSINEYLQIKQNKQAFQGKSILPMLGRYDKYSKYNEKNVARYLKEKKGICVIPYNTLFMEACNEGGVDEYFIKFRKINEKDKNAIFISNVKEASIKIIERLRELQMRM